MDGSKPKYKHTAPPAASTWQISGEQVSSVVWFAQMWSLIIKPNIAIAHTEMLV